MMDRVNFYKQKRNDLQTGTSGYIIQPPVFFRPSNKLPFFGLVIQSLASVFLWRYNEVNLRKGGPRDGTVNTHSTRR